MRLPFCLVFACFGLLAQTQPADPPALPGSGMPFFAQDQRGELYLSWIDPLANKRHALRLARWDGKSWSSPETVSEGANWFVNWADYPSVSFAPDGSLFAHWLARPEQGGKYGYGIRIARRAAPDGSPWQQVAAFNEKDPEDYAGFLSFSASTAAYLSPSTTVAHRKTLRLARFTPNGALTQDLLLDDDVCSCCQTTTVATPHGLLVAYRDHLPGEIRDISLIRIHDGKASPPEPLHRDGWQINGCPTEGPSAAAHGNAVGIAWITRAGGQSRLKLAWSGDGGRHFAAPRAIDEGNPLGRPHLIADPSGAFLLAWLERAGDGAEIRLRRITATGQAGPSLLVSRVTAARTTGLPRIAVHNGQVLVAWREDAVRVVRLPLASLALPGRQ